MDQRHVHWLAAVVVAAVQGVGDVPRGRAPLVGLVGAGAGGGREQRLQLGEIALLYGVVDGVGGAVVFTDSEKAAGDLRAA